jgi:hypothetical protein
MLKNWRHHEMPTRRGFGKRLRACTAYPRTAKEDMVAVLLWEAIEGECKFFLKISSVLA